VHAIDKHEKKIIYTCENIENKRPRNIIWLLFILFLFLEVVPSHTTQVYFTLHLTTSWWKISFNFQFTICPFDMWQTFASNMYVVYGLVIKHL